MAEQKEAKKVEAKKEVVTRTSVEFLKARALKGCKNREECVKGAHADATKAGVTQNSKGHKITEENLSSLLNAMCRDINHNKKGWWSNIKLLEETDVLFKFLQKQ